MFFFDSVIIICNYRTMEQKKGENFIISTYADDLILGAGGDVLEVREGGPALWISETLSIMGIPFGLISSTKSNKAKVKITLNSSGGEEGFIFDEPQTIMVDENIIADYFMISTIGDEFPLDHINYLKGKIVLDIQGYARKAMTLNKKVKIPKKDWPRIEILKATEAELKSLDHDYIIDQKNRILIVTKAEQGVDIYYNSKHIFLQAEKIKVSDTIGAGDVFLASFFGKYFYDRQVDDAGAYAVKFVSDFLRKKLVA